MKIVKNLLLYFFIGFNFLACSQSKSVIKKIYATYSVRMPGIIPQKSETNNVIADTVNMIYVETSVNEIQWMSARINNSNYSVQATPVNSKHLTVGTKKSDNKVMKIKISLKNYLWQLQLISDNKSLTDSEKTFPGEIILFGMYKNKKIIRRISKKTELIGQMTQ